MTGVGMDGVTDVELEPHRTLLRGAIEEARGDKDVIGLLLTGSVARGDALPGADLDLVLVLAEGRERPFVREWMDGILVERTYVSVHSARVQLGTRPMSIYGHLDGRILYDPQQALSGLRRRARSRLEAYETPKEHRAEVAFLLRCSRDKMRVALGGGDLLKAAYVAGTSSWQIMEGLWAANDLPMPPNSSAPTSAISPRARQVWGGGIATSSLPTPCRGWRWRCN